MVKHPFVANNTSPGLGAGDLASMMGAGFVIGFGGLRNEPRPKARRSLKDLLRKLAGFRSSAS
ncbi:MAG: hypothetical protein ACTSQ7_03515 [Alphaproteobacteria bacterium]